MYGFDKIDSNALLDKINSIVTIIVSLSRYLTPRVALVVASVCAVMLILGGIGSAVKKVALAGIFFCLLGLVIVYAAPVLVGFVMGLAK
jgi:predicted membrane protein